MSTLEDERKKNAMLLQQIYFLQRDKELLQQEVEHWSARAIRAEKMAEEAGEMLEDERDECECLKGIVERLKR